MGLNRGSVALAFLVSLMAVFGACSAGAVYRVGDSDNGSVVYNHWAVMILGDTNIFFEYNARFHNVKQLLKHHDSQYSNLTTCPKATYSIGGNSITLKRPTHLHFARGFPGHSQADQKTSSATCIGFGFSFSLGSLLLVALGLLMVWLLTRAGESLSIFS